MRKVEQHHELVLHPVDVQSAVSAASVVREASELTEMSGLIVVRSLTEVSEVTEATVGQLEREYLNQIAQDLDTMREEG